MAGSITQVRVGMGREGDWDDDTNFDKVSDDVFFVSWLSKKKKKEKKWAWKCKEEGEGVTQEPLL